MSFPPLYALLCLIRQTCRKIIGCDGSPYPPPSPFLYIPSSIPICGLAFRSCPLLYIYFAATTSSFADIRNACLRIIYTISRPAPMRFGYRRGGIQLDIMRNSRLSLGALWQLSFFFSATWLAVQAHPPPFWVVTWNAQKKKKKLTKKRLGDCKKSVRSISEYTYIRII